MEFVENTMVQKSDALANDRRIPTGADAWALPEPGGLAITPGEVFSSPSKTLTDAHFLLFSAISSDNHPIHYDIEYIKKTRFEKPIAHGLLVVALTALGASSISSQLEGFVFVEQGCKYLRPAMSGDTLSPRFKLEKIWVEDERRYAKFNTALINQNDEVILEGFHVYRIITHRKSEHTEKSSLSL